MSEFGAPRGKIDIGKVLQDLFAVLGRNFLTFFLLSLILTGIPAALLGYLQLGMVQSGTANIGLNIALSGLVAMVSGAVLQGALMHGAVADMNGRKLSVSESLAAGLRAFLPLIGIGILMAFGVVFGFILLIVPGVLMALAWCVTAPAYVAENRGVFESFNRSADLTRDNRWRILGLALIYFVLLIVGELIVDAVTGAVSLASGGELIKAVLITPVYSALTSVIGATGAAVLYVELRRLKEGLGPDTLASIFD